MNYRYCRIEDDGNIRIITINRPERRNALSTGLLEELNGAFHSTANDGVHCVILSAEGPAFSAGHDLAELSSGDPGTCANVFRACERLMLTMQQLAPPVIAEIQGVATAAGCQIAAAADLTLASEDAVFATPGVRIGLFCSTPMVPLVRAIGRKRAMEMLLTGEPITAATALSWGLVNRVVPLSELRSCSLALAQKIVAWSPRVVADGKRCFYETISLTDEQALESATETMIRSAQTDEAVEGMSAFLGKRRPVWPATQTVDDRHSR